MRISPSFALALTTLLVGLLASPASAADRQARIYGGGQVPITDVPFQAALIDARSTTATGQFCGGSILDPQHILTAAHCVFAGGQALRPNEVDVLVGTARLDDGSGTRVDVSEVSFDPRYDLDTMAYDVAVLTLASPLDLATGAARAATLDTASAFRATPPTTLRVSGWGRTETEMQPPRLREAQVPFRSDAACNAAWQGGIQPDLMICAGDGTFDSCTGDSGGPLSRDVGTSGARDLRLAGIVSFGPEGPCANAAIPGVYTELVDPAIRTYATQADPAAAPYPSAPPSLTGQPKVGDVVGCSPGGWTNALDFSYRFAREDQLVRGASSQSSYAVQPSDVGGRLWCEVTARGSGGFGIAASAYSAPVQASVDPNGPGAPQPNPNPGTNAPPPVPPPPTPLPMPAPRPTQPLDRVAPVARVAKASCRRDRCTLDVRVRDAGLSSGVRRIEVRVVSTYRSRCTRGGRRVACTRIRARTLRAAAVAGAAGRFTVRASGLARGRHTFSLRAVDKAGNRQAVAAKRTVRVSGRR